MSQNNKSNSDLSLNNNNNECEKTNDLDINKDINNDNNKESLKSEPNVKKVLNDSKENKSKYRLVESRYKQSAKQWTNKRNEDSVQNKSKESSKELSKESSTVSANSSKAKNPTPTSKSRLAKASTPVSADKSLNYLDVSAIPVANYAKDTKLEVNQNMKKWGTGLTTIRQSKRDLNPLLQREEAVVTSGTSRVPMSLLPLGQDSETKNKEIEKSISRSRYLQSVFLNLKAKQIKKQRDSDAIIKITQIWNINNELRIKLQKTQNSVKTLENTIKTIEILEKQKTFFENYLNIREKMDSLYNSFADLIDKQKLLLEVQNCSENDFEKLNGL
jgi:hypothetical protein